MLYNDIKNMKNGWMIGDFEPSVFRTKDFEAAKHFMTKDSIAVPHYHKLTYEFNYVIRGKIKVGGLNGNEKILTEGQIFIYEPNEIADGIAIEDTELFVIKWPSIPNDKYFV